MMLGLLLAKAGIHVTVLEKHSDFFRDFRGDTIHPSTLDLIDQLGLRERFDAIPHTFFRTLELSLNRNRIRPVDFGHLHGPNREVVLMPQWDFLTLLAEEARTHTSFHLVMDAEATRLRRTGGRVTGVYVTTPNGELEIEAALTVAADGRDSRIRKDSGLAVQDFGIAIDVLWFRLPKPLVEPPSTLGYLSQDTMIVTIPRSDYYQTAMLIPKNGFEKVRSEGLPQFRRSVVGAAEFLAPVIDSLQDWDQVKLLSVQINRLKRWHLPGFLCIGDAAHAMSPAFGVGINYALQDAVATANVIAAPLAAGTLREHHLARVQRRRAPAVRLMQPIQLMLHRVIARPGGGAMIPNPLPRRVRVALVLLLPLVRRVAARVVGRGFVPERIRAELLKN